ncbi:MAG: metallophosphoesterase [Clostridia bacterium]|nr:metallophosphoesterase [Clostridia bacterium]
MLLDITDYKINAGIPHKLRAAVIADIHDEKFDRVYSEIKARNVDFILIPGDIINGHRHSAVNSFEMLEVFQKTFPTFMSLGNHETVGYNEVIKTARNAGIELLEDRSVRFGGLNIGGLTSGYVMESEHLKQNHFRKTPEPRLDWLRRYAAEDGFKVLLCHHPEYYVRYVRNLPVDLTISGHAHGGQWRVFGQPLFAPGQGLFPKYAQGFHEGRLIVSRGLANNAPVPRFFNPRELIFIDFE